MKPAERKKKVMELFKEHSKYFKDAGIDPLYIPKMAYRPSGKDELHVSFFPSELQKGSDIYTEFVSIDYDSEDPKRTLYLWKHNPHFEEEYELVTSKSGFERYMIPVSELKVINDINSRNNVKETIAKLSTKDFDVKGPEDRTMIDVLIGIEKALLSINNKLKK
tara:strand:+ start:1601 stop:2092 length:492 start_codon:yes stop_codon:yes gene_type:complete